MKIFSSCLLAFLLILGLGSIGICQQTGSLKGTVTDDQGNPLPGVVVNLTSPALIRPQSYVSTQAGDFRFPMLPPGMYLLRVELAGFKTAEMANVQVRIGATATVNLQMQPAALDVQVKVSAARPLVDIESAEISVTITKDTILNLPIRRDVLDLYQTAPAAVPMTSANDYMKQTSVAGASVEASKLAIDGVDLVDTSRGYVSADIAYDAIDEVEMVVGGLKAEVGQASAGFLNVLTKSGGNTFSGSFTATGSSKDFGQVIVPQDIVASAGLLQPQVKKYKYDFGLALGGPIIKDKAWFFLSPKLAGFAQSTYFVPFTDPDGVYHAAFDNVRKDKVGLGKITVQISKNLKWFGMYQYSSGFEAPQMWAVTLKYNPRESQKTWDDSAHTVSSVLTFVLDQNTFVDGRFGMVLRHMYLPYWNQWEGPVNRVATTDRFTLYNWGESQENAYLYRKNTWNSGLTVARFQDGFLGADHEFKAGVEYSRSLNDRPGQRINPYFKFTYNGSVWADSDTVPYKGRFSIYSGAIAPNLSAYKAAMWRMSVFLQDTFNVGKRLTIYLGVRFDNSHGYTPAIHWTGWNDTFENGLANILLPSIFLPEGQSIDVPQIDDIMVYKFLSPRIGLSYDLFGDGQTVFKGSFSRYGDSLLTSAVENVIPVGEKTVSFQWFDDNRDGIFSLPPIDRYIVGSYTAYSTDVAAVRKQIASDLKTPYTNELTLGITQTLFKDFSISLNFMNKNSKNMLGQRNLNIAKNSEWWIPYTVTDPGDDGQLGTGNEQQLTVYMLRSDAPVNLIQRANISEATRKYWGFNLIFNKRMSNGWMLNGSIAVSKAYGNFPNGYLTFSGNQNFWDPNQDINRTGRLEYDRPFIAKLMSTIQLPFGFVYSAYFRYYTGWHYTRQVTVYFPATLNGYTPRSTSVTIFAEPQRERSFQPEAYLDMRLEKTFKLGSTNLGIWVDLQNLFGFYAYTYSQNMLTGGYIYANGTFARFPNYGKPDAVGGTREIAFGGRIRF